MQEWLTSADVFRLMSRLNAGLPSLENMNHVLSLNFSCVSLYVDMTVLAANKLKRYQKLMPLWEQGVFRIFL